MFPPRSQLPPTWLPAPSGADASPEGPSNKIFSDSVISIVDGIFELQINSPRFRLDEPLKSRLWAQDITLLPSVPAVGSNVRLDDLSQLLVVVHDSASKLRCLGE